MHLPVSRSCLLLPRIPLPELKDSDKLDKIMYMKEATKRIRLGPDTLPSICFYTFLNAYQVNNSLSQQLTVCLTCGHTLERVAPGQLIVHHRRVFCKYLWLFLLQGLTAVDFTDDSSLIAGGFADSTVRVWSITPKKLRKVKSAAGTVTTDA